MLVALIGASPGVGLSIIPRLELALPGLIPISIYISSSIIIGSNIIRIKLVINRIKVL